MEKYYTSVAIMCDPTNNCKVNSYDSIAYSMCSLIKIIAIAFSAC